MYKVTFQPSAAIKVEFDASNPKEYMEKMQAIEEVAQHTTCGKCGGKQVLHVVRTVNGNKFYEKHCANSQCRAVVSFGANKEGKTLFTKRFEEVEEDGETVRKWFKTPWTKYNKETGRRE